MYDVSLFKCVFRGVHLKQFKIRTTVVKSLNSNISALYKIVKLLLLKFKV